MNPDKSWLHRVLAFVLSGLIAVPAPLFAATTDISQQPLAQPASNVKPNIMLLQDDSMSMRQQYTPDYLGRPMVTPVDFYPNPLCFDTKDSNGNIVDTVLRNCEAGDVPLMTPDINTQYYSPEIHYSPAVNYDGSVRTNMDAASTTNWTVVPTDNVSSAGINLYRKDTKDMNPVDTAAVINNVNLAAGYPDRLWCYDQAANVASTFSNAQILADPLHLTGFTPLVTLRCRINSAYSYPSDTFGYGLTAGSSVNATRSNIKFVNGAPYYYRLVASEYCSDIALTTCMAATVPTGAFIYPAPVRYCTGTNPTTQAFASCQAKYRAGFIYPRWDGNVSLSTGVAGRVAVGTINIPVQKDSADIVFTALNVNGVDILNVAGFGNLTITGGQSQNAIATALRDAINTRNNVHAPTLPFQYHATCNITPPAPPPPPPPPKGEVPTDTKYAGLELPAKGVSSANFATSFTSMTQVAGIAAKHAKPAIPAKRTSNADFATSFTSMTQVAHWTTAVQVLPCQSGAVTVRYGPSAVYPNPSAGAVVYPYPPSNSGTPGMNTGTPDDVANGYTIVPAFSIGVNTQATATVTITGTSSGKTFSSITVAPTGSLIAAGFSCPASALCGTAALQATKDAYMATTLATAINARTGVTGYTAVAAANVVTITGSLALGSFINGVNPVTGGTVTRTPTAFTGGITAGDMDNTTVNFSQGIDPAASSVPSRANVGNFVRTDITPWQNPPTNTIPKTFTKYPNRDDCITTPGICTYAEEMTNFANWYSYYRSRMQMAKSAIGIAFNNLNNNYRIGFMTINVTATTLGTRFLATDDFNAGAAAQKDLWYQRLYGTVGSAVLAEQGTPLREALSRVGRYYAGVATGINFGGALGASPILLACQPNYTILVTDGYWNGNGGLDLTDLPIGNQDYVNSGWSLRTEARFDGNLPASTNTLADVAMYYYFTDLRTDLANTVPVTTKDPAPFQHMTTYTVGLGLAGRLNFDPQYEAGASPDFERLKIAPASGGLDWPSPLADDETALDDLWHAAVNGRGTFFSAKDPHELAQGITDTLNTVSARVGAGAAAATSNLQPVAGDNFAFTAQYETVSWIGDLKARTIDLSTGIVAQRQLWSASDQLQMRTQTSRNIYTLDAGDTGSPGNGNKLKSFCYPAAMNTGPYPTCTDGAGLVDPAEMDQFKPQATSPAPASEPRLSQSPPWLTDGSGRNVSATRESLVDYLRGETMNENAGTSTPSDLYRARNQILGDIINAQPAYVKASPFDYLNTGVYVDRNPFYDLFKAAIATRKGTVFASANDGMLHAFETDPDNIPYYQTGGIATSTLADDTFVGTLSTNPATGEGAERWTYVPNMLFPYLKRLADDPYSHRYFTDGSPVVGDVCFGHSTATPCAAQANWRTLLVAGLNGGGRGYYALDITDPDNPKALWEIQGGAAAVNCGMSSAQARDGTRYDDCNIGLSFGNPLIAKRASDGKWVVIFSSGYNNVSPGTGRGYLYVVDAQTGLILRRYGTGVGSAGTPSGLGKINAWVDAAVSDNTALTVYGGDLQGNLWRFELDGVTYPSVPVDSVTRLGILTDPAGATQAITTKPELGLVTNKRAVFIGTGKYLGDTDKPDIQRNSFYAIRDDMNSTTDPVTDMTRTGTYPASVIAGFVNQTLIPNPAPGDPLTERTTAANASVAFSSPTDRGWFIDLPDGGTAGNPSERVNVDPILQLGTLVVASNVPNSDACAAGGYGWLNFLDYKTGAYVPGSTNNLASQKISTSLIVGVNVIQLPGGQVKTIVTTADNQQLTEATPVGAVMVQGRRVSWRELFNE